MRPSLAHALLLAAARDGDVLRRLGSADLGCARRAHRPGDALDLAFYWAGEVRTTQVTLEERS